MDSNSREGSPAPSARPNRPSVKLNTKAISTPPSDHLGRRFNSTNFGLSFGLITD